MPHSFWLTQPVLIVTRTAHKYGVLLEMEKNAQLQEAPTVVELDTTVSQEHVILAVKMMPPQIILQYTIQN